MARLLVLGAAAVLLCAGLAAGAAANEGCRDVITGYSGTFGKRASGGTERFNNQTTQWRSKGAITKVNLYYSAAEKCIEGIKITYGYDSRDARLIGQEKGLATKDLTLGAGESFNKAQIKANGCVEYLRLVTNRGRVLELGNAASGTQLITSYPNKPTGFLAAVRGYEEYSGSNRGALKTVQMVWANCNPLNGGVPKPTSPATRPAPTPAPRPAPTFAPAPAEAPADISGEPEPTGAAAAATGAAATGVPEVTCPAMLDQCAPEASSTSTAYCPVLAPFTSAACLGGCCVSSGKCTSSSCAISGLGKEVPNTICYGLNPAIAIGASPNCRGLACKLAVPGCTSDLLGGSCVGTVVDLSGKAAADNPSGAALVGYPCLDVTPSDKTLTADGKLSLSGGYVAKLWSICDCAAPATIGHTNIPVPRLGKLNLTDIKSLVDVLKPGLGLAGGASNGSHPLASIMEAVKSKIPALIVPDGANAVNLTNALGFLGSLVGKGAAAINEAGPAAGGAGGSPQGAIANFLKGAAALAESSNSTNPLGSLLGALAPAGPNGEKNPLAGLGNLVSALAPQGADSTEKADVLNSILGGLSGSTAAAPVADLVGTISKMLQGAGPDSPVANIAALLPKIKGNSSDIMKTVMDAVQKGKEAVANGQIDLNAILEKAKEYVGKDGGVDGQGNPTVSAILNGIQQLANPHGAEGGASNNPVEFINNIRKTLNGSDGTSFSLQSLLDAASQAGPVLQQLLAGAGGGGDGAGADGAAAGANPLAGIMRAISGGEGGQGLDLNGVMSLARKAAPMLQSLGGGTGGGAAVPGGNPLKGIMDAVGLGAGGDGQGLDMERIRGLLDAAKKAGPVLQSLVQASGAGGNNPLASVAAFLDKMKDGHAAAPAAT